MPNLTMEEVEVLLEAVAQQQAEGPKDAFTISEAADAWGVSKKTARKRLRPLRKEGKVEDLRVPRKVAGGHTQMLVGYRFTCGVEELEDPAS